MNPAAGPFAICALVLVLGGCLKAVRPGDTSNAVRALGVPVHPLAVRLGGAAEAAVGAYAVGAGDRAAAVLVALSYVGFAVFVALALRRDLPIATCGCFGRADTPPSIVHIGVDAAAALAAIAVVVDPGVGIVATLRSQPLSGAPYLLLVGTGVSAVFLALTALPRAMALVRTARSG